MHRNEQNGGIDSRTDASVSIIRSDASSNDASSGTSSSAREPQQGSAIDNSSGNRDEQQGGSRPDGTATR